MSRVTPWTGAPSSSTLPSVGAMSPDTMLRIVDLPQPLGPTMVRSSPVGTSSDIPSRAVTMRSRAKNRLPMFVRRSIGSPRSPLPASPDRRDGVDLDHQLGLREAPHLDRGAGRHGVAVIFHADVGVLEILVDIGDVGV